MIFKLRAGRYWNNDTDMNIFERELIFHPFSGFYHKNHAAKINRIVVGSF